VSLACRGADGFKLGTGEYAANGEHRLGEMQIRRDRVVLVVGPDSKGEETSGADGSHESQSPLLSRCSGIPVVSCTSRTPPLRRENTISEMSGLVRPVLRCRRYSESADSYKVDAAKYPFGVEIQAT